MKKAIITLGYPASGKNFFIENYCKQENYIILDSDSFNIKNYEVRKELKTILLKESIKRNCNLIIMSTGGSLDLLKTAQELIKQNYILTIFDFITDYEICYTWNKKRDRHAPQEAFDKVRENINTVSTELKQIANYYYKIQPIIKEK